MNRIVKKLNARFYDEETGNMLNYLTLKVSDKLIEKDIAAERAIRIDKYYPIVLTVASVPFFI